MKRVRLAATAVAVAFLVVATARGQQPPPPDQLVLKNGDRLTGVLVTMADGVITFRSEPLGEIQVPLDQVATMASGGALELHTAGGETLRRQVAEIRDGALVLADAPGGPAGLTVPLATLQAINPPQEPAAVWTGSFALGGSYSAGNTERRSIGATLDAERRSEADRFIVRGAWDYAEDKQNGVWQLNQRRLSGDLEYNLFLSERAYALAQTGALGDTLADIELRYTAGAGLGYQWWETEELALSTELGVSYFSENYRSAMPSEETLAARGAYSLRWQLLPDVALLQDVQAFQGLERSDDIFVTADTRARVSLTEAMFAQLQWVLDYDNTPSQGRDRIDHRVLAQLGWSF